MYYQKLKNILDAVRVVMIAMIISIIAIAIGTYLGFKQFKAEIEQEIEQKCVIEQVYPVPVEMLKEI